MWKLHLRGADGFNFTTRLATDLSVYPCVMSTVGQYQTIKRSSWKTSEGGRVTSSTMNFPIFISFGRLYQAGAEDLRLMVDFTLIIAVIGKLVWYGRNEIFSWPYLSLQVDVGTLDVIRLVQVGLHPHNWRLRGNVEHAWQYPDGEYRNSQLPGVLLIQRPIGYSKPINVS